MTNISRYEDSLLSSVNLVVLNVGLAILIFLCGMLGSYFAIRGASPDFYVSPVWPAPGFSLASLLLFGTQMWPGILLGNFAVNLHALSLGDHSQFAYGFFSLVIAIGSLLQAFLGAYIMRHYSSKGLFDTVLDVFVFLFPAGLLTCLVASTIGVTAMTFYSQEVSASQDFFHLWLPFWLGDLLGVYIFTPLIIVWLTKQFFEELTFSNFIEILCMFGALVVMTVLTYIKDYPVFHLTIPLAVWVTYRYHMFGATAAILLIALAAVIPQSMGLGPYNNIGTIDPVLLLVSFVETIVVSSLFLGAALGVKELKRFSLEKEKINLQAAVDTQEVELKSLSGEMFISGKMASIGLNALDIAKRIREPFYRMMELTQSSLNSVGRLEELAEKGPVQWKEGETRVFENNVSALDHQLRGIADYQAEVNWIVDYIQEQSVKVSPENVKITTVNLHALLDLSLSRAISIKKQQYPTLIFNVVKKYDKKVKTLATLAEDLSHALVQLFNNAIDSMSQKKERLQEGYYPVLEVSTLLHPDMIEIIILDNGEGSKAEGLVHVALKDAGSALAMGAQLAYDVFVHVHHGDIIVNAENGEYTQWTLRIPKGRL